MRTPRILKPRHKGKLLSEAEILALVGRELDALIAVCFFGYEWMVSSGCPPGLADRAGSYLVDRINNSMFGSAFRQTWSVDEPDCKRHFEWAGDLNHYSTDVTRAYTIDQPDWSCDMIEYVTLEFSLEYNIDQHWQNGDVRTTAGVKLELKHKPTVKDQARARCLSALLMATKIGD